MKGFMAIDQGYEQEDEHFLCDYLVADRQLEYVQVDFYGNNNY